MNTEVVKIYIYLTMYTLKKGFKHFQLFELCTIKVSTYGAMNLTHTNEYDSILLYYK